MIKLEKQIKTNQNKPTKPPKPKQRNIQTYKTWIPQNIGDISTKVHRTITDRNPGHQWSWI